MDAILTNTLLPQISQLLLSACARDEQYQRLHISLDHDEFRCEFQV